MAYTTRCSQRAKDFEVMHRALVHENDILRFQLNDLISREKNQRLELQRMRTHRDVEVSTMVQASTQKLKGEIDHLQGLLKPTTSQLLQAVSEKTQAITERDQAILEMESMRNFMKHDNEETKRLHIFQDLLDITTSMVTTIIDSVEAFQKHVLPTFRPTRYEINKFRQMASKVGSQEKIVDELQRLEAGISLLRVIVDAKNDTLVLIRGKLKQENEDLKAELAAAKEQSANIKPKKDSVIGPTNTTTTPKVDSELNIEKKLLRQEFQALQDLYHAKMKQMMTKMKEYEQEGAIHQTQFGEVQRECQALQAKVATIDASRQQLEICLKDETVARSQLVSQVFHLRKDNDKLKVELDTLKMSQKFLVRPPRKGSLSIEKMDLMNTVNQLLLENSKLKDEKVTLEEEVKLQRRTNAKDRVKGTVTSHDVALCANNKVGDVELASKLARVRLQHLGPGPTQFINGSPTLSNILDSDNPRITLENSHLDATRGENASMPQSGENSHMMNMMGLEAGEMGLAQLAGLRERGIMRRSTLS